MLYNILQRQWVLLVRRFWGDGLNVLLCICNEVHMPAGWIHEMIY
jgi:hypothetical protein